MRRVEFCDSPPAVHTIGRNRSRKSFSCKNKWKKPDDGAARMTRWSLLWDNPSPCSALWRLLSSARLCLRVWPSNKGICSQVQLQFFPVSYASELEVVFHETADRSIRCICCIRSRSFSKSIPTQLMTAIHIYIYSNFDTLIQCI